MTDTSKGNESVRFKSTMSKPNTSMSMDELREQLHNLLMDTQPKPMPEPLWSPTDVMNYERAVMTIEVLEKDIMSLIDAHTEEKVREADDKAHMIGFKNGKWAITYNLKIWVEKRARVTNVQNINGICNGQYVRVDDLLDHIKALTNKGKGDTNE